MSRTDEKGSRRNHLKYCGLKSVDKKLVLSVRINLKNDVAAFKKLQF